MPNYHLADTHRQMIFRLSLARLAAAGLFRRSSTTTQPPRSTASADGVSVPLPKATDTLQLAFAKGKLLGSDLDKSGRDCPYMHDQPALRLEWMRGFSEARIALRQPTPPLDGHA